MKRVLGFSLLELLIVMTIVAILLAISYPSYVSHMVKARRDLAAIDLLYIASQLENYYSVHGTYEGATLQSLGVGQLTDDRSYLMSLQSLTDSNYFITATPQGHQAVEDPKCQILMTNEQGEKLVSGNGNPDSCWN